MSRRIKNIIAPNITSSASRVREIEQEEEEGVDPLAVINAELREQDAPEDDPDSPWLPLESNPEIFTDFAHKSGGLPKNWGWVDILGLDPELLAMVPEPCAGVILLFPCSDNIYRMRKVEKQRLLQQLQQPTAATSKAYHVQQVAEFGNACGTIASVHALINGASVYKGTSSALSKFRQDQENASALDRGKALLQTNDLRSSSDSSAAHLSSQTALPDRYGPDLDHHFVAFSPISLQDSDSDDTATNTHVIELDGTKVCPVDHGSIAQLLHQEETDSTIEDDPNKHAFLRAVAQVIRANYMQVEPDSIEFSMMALCRIK